MSFLFNSLGDPDPGLSAGAIAGIAVGSVVGLVIIIVVLEQCCKGNVTVGAVTEEPRRGKQTHAPSHPPIYTHHVSLFRLSASGFVHIFTTQMGVRVIQSKPFVSPYDNL